MFVRNFIDTASNCIMEFQSVNHVKRGSRRRTVSVKIQRKPPAEPTPLAAVAEPALIILRDVPVGSVVRKWDGSVAVLVEKDTMSCVLCDVAGGRRYEVAEGMEVRQVVGHVKEDGR